MSALQAPLSAAMAISALWLVSWMIAAAWRSPAARRPVFGSQALYNLVTIAGVLMIFSVRSFAGSWVPLALQWLLVVAAVGGYAFCWWARIHLGALWSGSVTRKDNHHIVDTGPYGLVRHPIYTGLIASGVAIALIKADLVSLLGAALFALGFWIKARLEESFLRSELGAEAYDAYAARVPMLIPFAPR